MDRIQFTTALIYGKLSSPILLNALNIGISQRITFDNRHLQNSKSNTSTCTTYANNCFSLALSKSKEKTFEHRHLCQLTNQCKNISIFTLWWSFLYRLKYQQKRTTKNALISTQHVNGIAHIYTHTHSLNGTHTCQLDIKFRWRCITLFVFRFFDHLLLSFFPLWYSSYSSWERENEKMQESF